MVVYTIGYLLMGLLAVFVVAVIGIKSDWEDDSVIGLTVLSGFFWPVTFILIIPGVMYYYTLKLASKCVK